jgi:pilus assembly protein CpaC
MARIESEDLNMIAAHTTTFRRSRPLKGRRPAAFFGALVVFIIVILVAAPQAQQPPAFNPATSPASASAVRDAVSGSEIDLMVGRSTVLNIGAQIARVSLTVPDIADALVTAPSQILVHGKQPGTISLFVWDKSGGIKTFEVKVRRDLSALITHLKQLFPGEDITALGSGKDVVLSGTVSSKYVIEKAADVAAGYVEKKENVVNMLKQQEGVASNQVMLRVRFAEVSRSALQELGVSFFANGYKQDWFGRTAPPGVPAPDFDSDKGLVFSDFLNIFVFNADKGLGGVVKALQTKGLFQSLAEPNLIATNGKEASFLAGGEYPYPVVQSGSGNNAVTIMFKEFGIRLTFTPTVLGGDLINLKVKPEVSSLDFANAVILDGFRVPALSTRRTETEVELRDGQTFAIAGLMNNTLTQTLGKIPGIGDIPVLGLLFRSKAHQKNQTELVVMITPTIIRKGQMGVSDSLPSLVEPYMNRPNKTYPNPDPYQGSPRYPADQAQPKEGNGAPARKAADNVPAPTAPAATTSAAPAPVPSRPIAQDAPVTAAPAPRASAPAPQPQPQQTAAKPPVATPAPAPVKQTAAPAQSTQKAPAQSTQKQSQALKDASQKQTEQQKAQARAEEKAREQERKAAEAEARQKADEQRVAQQKAEADARKNAEQEKVAQAKADEDRRQAERLSKERAKREAEIARKNAEVAKKQADDDQKREKALADAAARLKQAQAAYQAEIDKTKGSNDKPKDPGKEPGGAAPKH